VHGHGARCHQRWLHQASGPRSASHQLSHPSMISSASSRHVYCYLLSGTQQDTYVLCEKWSSGVCGESLVNVRTLLGSSYVPARRLEEEAWQRWVGGLLGLPWASVSSEASDGAIMLDLRAWMCSGREPPFSDASSRRPVVRRPELGHVCGNSNCWGPFLVALG